MAELAQVAGRLGLAVASTLVVLPVGLVAGLVLGLLAHQWRPVSWLFTFDVIAPLLLLAAAPWPWGAWAGAACWCALFMGRITTTALALVPESLMRVSRTLGARGLRLSLYVGVPAAAPGLLHGGRIALLVVYPAAVLYHAGDLSPMGTPLVGYSVGAWALGLLGLQWGVGRLGRVMARYYG